MLTVIIEVLQMKKLSEILFNLFLAFLLVGAVSCSKSKTLTDGTFIGTGAGHGGDVTVSITVKDGQVTDAKILHEAESPEIGPVAEQQILERFMQEQKTETIDVVSGATITSNAVLDALEMALNKSRGIEEEKVVYSDTSCDIVIIGAGGAGLVAATEAANKGAKVIVLEKMGIVGGNTNYSTGGINASYTKEQKKLGIKDSPDVFYSDTMKGGKNLNDPALVRTLVDNSAAMVEWLQSDIVGADLSDVGMFGGATNKRIHRPQGGQAIGAHLVPLLHQAALRQGAEIRVNSMVTDIIKNDGKACGVIVKTRDNQYKIDAKAVIVASGGFGANSAMVVKFNPALAGFGTTNHPGATGDAFLMTEKFDAQLTQMEQIQTHPTVVAGTGIMITEAVRGNGAILVSRTGKRFVNEMQTRDLVSAAILAQPKKTAFLVFDQSVRDSLKAIEGYAKKNLLTQADSIDELADKLGIDKVEFNNTIRKYTSYVESKTDEEFKRNAASMERTLSKAPYYAIECGPAIHHTMGGLKINPKAEVQNKSGNTVPGLYAAGEVTGGVHGANRLGGNAVADICIFGKIAADSAVEYINRQ